jgi:hypothetical protein
MDQDYREKTSPVWDMSQERALCMATLNQRFNFVLVFASVIVAAAINSREGLLRAVVLTLGALICLLLALAIYTLARMQGRILLHILTDETHPGTIVQAGSALFVGRWVVGYVVPTILWTALTVGAVLAWWDHLKSAGCPVPAVVGP